MPAYKDVERGYWYVSFRYKDWTGRSVHTTRRGFATKAEAQKAEREFLESLKRTPDMKFAVLVDKYLEYQSSRLKPTTINGNTYIIKSRILPYFERKKLNEITASDIIEWQNAQIAYRDENGKAYTQTYLRKLHASLSAIFNFAVRTYGLAVNPCRQAQSIGASRRTDLVFWTKDQFDQFIAHVEKPAFHLFFNTLFYTGLRCGEALALTLEDILPDKRISVNKNFAVLKGKELILTPKNESSNRTISIPDFLYDEFQAYTSKLYGFKPKDRIFYFQKSAVQRELQKHVEEAGLPKIRVHDLRHSHASLLIEMGFDIMEISKRLGHSSVKMTWDVYAHLYPNKDMALADRLNAIQEPSKEEIEMEISGDD